MNETRQGRAIGADTAPSRSSAFPTRTAAFLIAGSAPGGTPPEIRAGTFDARVSQPPPISGQQEPEERGLRRILRSLADLLGAGSNHFAEVLREWNDVLKHSSLGRSRAKHTKEGANDDAPRDGRKAIGRRHKPV